MAKEEATYTHGHHESVVRGHSQRTAQNSAGFLLPHIKSTDSILDVGCGPGTISCDLAQLVPEGELTGVDASESVLEKARNLAKTRDIQNITFQAVDANKLPFTDASFDIVYCHQVLQHVKDPVGVLKEMRRVAKPGGIVAARESDYKSFAWYPESADLDKWGELYQKSALANGGEPNAGRMLHKWARQAGFNPDDVQMTWNSWCYRREEARFWGDMWADRALYSDFYKTTIERGVATDADMQAVSKAWKKWGQEEDAFIGIPSAEILCRVT